MNKTITTGYAETYELSRQQVLDQVPEAWRSIVDKMIDDLFAAGWDGRLSQIKEKFGSLRFYIPHNTEATDEIINKAEADVTKVCIQCGKPATGRTDGWITYVCDEHKR